jgi:hypothetical protein
MLFFRRKRTLTGPRPGRTVEGRRCFVEAIGHAALEPCVGARTCDKAKGLDVPPVARQTGEGCPPLSPAIAP